jgi:hypothetical protein
VPPVGALAKQLRVPLLGLVYLGWSAQALVLADAVAQSSLARLVAHRQEVPVDRSVLALGIGAVDIVGLDIGALDIEAGAALDIEAGAEALERVAQAGLVDSWAAGSLAVGKQAVGKQAVGKQAGARAVVAHTLCAAHYRVWLMAKAGRLAAALGHWATLGAVLGHRRVASPATKVQVGRPSLTDGHWDWRAVVVERVLVADIVADRTLGVRDSRLAHPWTDSFAHFASVQETSLALIVAGYRVSASPKSGPAHWLDWTRLRTYTWRHCRLGSAHKNAQPRQSSTRRTFGRPHMPSHTHQDWPQQNGHSRHFGPVPQWQNQRPGRKQKYARA